MGCCSVTQRHTGVDEVGPDEIELLELSGDNLGVWTLSENRAQLSVRNSRDEQQPAPQLPCKASVRHLEQEVVLWGRTRDELHHRIYSQQLIRGWEGQPAHVYGEVIHSSVVSLYNKYSEENSERFLLLFSFHLLILSLDHSQEDFIYEGILPVSGLSVRAVSLELDASHPTHMFEITSAMMDSKVFTCASAGESQRWIQHIEDRRYESMMQPMSPSQCALSYLLPCDENWKREELKKYLMEAPIWNWEGSPIHHMGQPGHLSIVHIINTQRQYNDGSHDVAQDVTNRVSYTNEHRSEEELENIEKAFTLHQHLFSFSFQEGLQERLMILFPQDLLLLSVDSKRLHIKYEGRLARQSIKAVERSALPGRLEFELRGELLETLQVSCTCTEDYQAWIFHLQQPDRDSHIIMSQPPPPLMLKLQRNRKESQEPILAGDQCQSQGKSFKSGLPT